MPPHEEYPETYRRRFDSLTTGRTAEHVEAVYEQAQSVLVGRLRAELAYSAVFTPTTLTAYRRRILIAQTQLADRLTGNVLSALSDVHTESWRLLNRTFAQMNKTPVREQRALFEETKTARMKQAEAELKKYFSRWATDITDRTRAEIKAGILKGESAGLITNRVEALLTDDKYRVERIARTESAFAYNAGQNDGIEILARQYPGTLKRWCERVSDTTWRPMDNRVANDSLVLHGQVTEATGLFTMPQDNTVDSRMWGEMWDFPPNRPMDRAVVMPWRQEWGVPAWQYVGGQRKWLVAR